MFSFSTKITRTKKKIRKSSPILCMVYKILESEVNDSMVHHVFREHRLASDRQWAYRQGYSTELLLVHLTETWRMAVDSGLIVAVAFVDFRKAFDSVSHQVLLEKLWHL